MADRTDILDRADSLMRRRRGLTPEAPADESAAVLDDENLPILTEVIPLDDTRSNDDVAETPEEPQLAQRANEMAQAIEQQLAADLLALFDRVLRQARVELQAGLSASLATAQRGFITKSDAPPPSAPPPGTPPPGAPPCNAPTAAASHGCACQRVTVPTANAL